MYSHCDGKTTRQRHSCYKHGTALTMTSGEQASQIVRYSEKGIERHERITYKHSQAPGTKDGAATHIVAPNKQDSTRCLITHAQAARTEARLVTITSARTTVSVQGRFA